MSSPPRPPASAARSRGSGAGRSPGWRLGSNRHQPDVGRGQIAERQDAGTKPGTNEDALVPIANIDADEPVAIARDIADRADKRKEIRNTQGIAGKNSTDGRCHSGGGVGTEGWGERNGRPRTAPN